MPAISFLIADPNQAVQTFIRQQLESYGFDASSIKTVSTPRAGVEAAAEIKPDFLLTDSFAKEAMSGLGLHHAVLKHNPYCNFALLCTKPSAAEQDDAAQAGAYFILEKPFTVDQFRDALAQALQQLARKHPQIARKIEQQAQAKAASKVTTAPARVVLPELPQYKPGDQVSYLNRRESVKHVILRRGELVVQLHGIPGQIEASKLQRL